MIPFDRMNSDVKTLQAEAELFSFLDDIKSIRKDLKGILPKNPKFRFEKFLSPTVFFSYAWGENHDIKFQNLQKFLRILKKDLTRADINVWFDEPRMAGVIEDEERNGIENSHLILLMGTEIYASKTGQNSLRNVMKELRFALAKTKRNKGNINDCHIMPILFEKTPNEIFHALSPNPLMAMLMDITNCIDLTQGKLEFREYIDMLTSWDLPGKRNGFLSIVLGLVALPHNELGGDYLKALQHQYKIRQKLLQTSIEKIYSEPEVSTLHLIKNIVFSKYFIFFIYSLIIFSLGLWFGISSKKCESKKNKSFSSNEIFWIFLVVFFLSCNRNNQKENTVNDNPNGSTMNEFILMTPNNLQDRDNLDSNSFRP